jgi:hypothetical protein
MRLIFLTLIAFSAGSATIGLTQPQAPTLSLAAARASLAGRWEGQLEYLDYSANKWFGIPVTTLVEDQGDGATLIRKSDFDDGPKVGNVRITSVELFDAAKNEVTIGAFRKGRETELMVYTVRFEGVPKDATHWTMVEEAKARDDDRPARLRLTTVRDGAKLQTLKQVDFLDDNLVKWMSRNRTTLSLVPSATRSR